MDVKPLKSDNLFQGLYLKSNNFFKEKADKKKRREDKILTLAGGILLTEGLKQLGVETERIQLGEKGKPYIDGVFFNIAHSGDFTVCAFGETDIGVDIEKNRSVSENVLEKISLPEEREKHSPLEIWTRKESFAKCIGTGRGEDVWKTDLSEDKICCAGKIYRIKTLEIKEYVLSVCAEGDFPPDKIVEI